MRYAAERKRRRGTCIFRDYNLISNGEFHFHVLSYLDGDLYKFGEDKPEELLLNIGRLAGRVTKAMEGYDNPEAHFAWLWDVKSVDTVVAQRDHFLTDEHRALFARLLPKYLKCTEGFADMPHSVIHSDMNDTNFLIENNDVKGLLDFGDCIWSPTVFEVGVCMAYWSLMESDIFIAFGRICRGYQEAIGRLLSDTELRVIYGVALGRMLTSVVSGLESMAREPDNEYVSQTVKPALTSLRQHDAVSLDEALKLLSEHVRV